MCIICKEYYEHRQPSCSILVSGVHAFTCQCVVSYAYYISVREYS